LAGSSGEVGISFHLREARYSCSRDPSEDFTATQGERLITVFLGVSDSKSLPKSFKIVVKGVWFYDERHCLAAMVASEWFGGKEQPNTECGPADDCVVAVVGGEEESNTQGCCVAVVVSGARAPNGRTASNTEGVEKRGQIR